MRTDSARFQAHSLTDDLSSRSEDDAVGLRIAAVSRIARRVDKVCAMTVIPDDGTSVISTIGVGFCELELSVGVDLRLGTVDVFPDRIGGIDCAGRVEIRNVELIDRRHITGEGEVLSIGREVQRQFRL